MIEPTNLSLTYESRQQALDDEDRVMSSWRISVGDPGECAEPDMLPEDGSYNEEELFEIGHIRAHVVNVSRAMDLALDPLALMDSVDTEMAAMAATFFQNLDSDGIAEAFSLNGPSLLVLDWFALDPRYRGQGLGLVAMAMVIERFSAECAVVLLVPHSLPSAENEAPDEEEILEGTPEALRVLRATWMRTDRQGVWLFDCTLQRCWDKLEQHLSPR